LTTILHTEENKFIYFIIRFVQLINMLLFSACDGHSNGKYITAKNIQDFENCTIINGNLRIFEASFQG